MAKGFFSRIHSFTQNRRHAALEAIHIGLGKFLPAHDNHRNITQGN